MAITNNTQPGHRDIIILLNPIISTIILHCVIEQIYSTTIMYTFDIYYKTI